MRMKAFSCIVNLKTNLTKNIPYYKTTLTQMSSVQSEDIPFFHIDEHSATAFSGGTTLCKICEGYQFSIVFDGELTKCEGLKKELEGAGYTFYTDSDDELVLTSYIHFGKECFQRLCGSFRFIIYDGMRCMVMAAVSAGASEPLYRCVHEDNVLIATQIKGILSYPDITPSITADGIKELLSVPTACSRAVFKDIVPIVPNSILTITKKGLSVKRYDTSKQDVKPNKATRVELAKTERELNAALRNLVIQNDLPLLAVAKMTDENKLFYNVLIKNKLLYKPVEDSLDFEGYTPPEVCYSTPFELCFNDTQTQKAQEQSAKRLLLKIAADTDSPVCAFFDKSALVSLCEGGCDFRDSQITPTALILYIIMLNIWFLEYTPRIV